MGKTAARSFPSGKGPAKSCKPIGNGKCPLPVKAEGIFYLRASKFRGGVSHQPAADSLPVSVADESSEEVPPASSSADASVELSSAVLSAASLESAAVLSVPAELSPAVSSEDVPEVSSDASSEVSSEAASEDSSDEVELVEVLVDVLLDEEEELSVSLPQLARASAHADTAASSATAHNLDFFICHFPF